MTITIECVTEVDTSGWEQSETHTVKINGKVVVTQSDNFEPEDVRFYRDLTSPFEVVRAFKEAIIASEGNLDFKFISTTVERETN